MSTESESLHKLLFLNISLFK